MKFEVDCVISVIYLNILAYYFPNYNCFLALPLPLSANIIYGRALVSLHYHH